MTLQSYKHKIIYVVLTTVAAYFSFQSLDLILDLYQVDTYMTVAWYVFVFHILWLAFVFDLHLKTKGHIQAARLLGKQGLAMFLSALAFRIKHFWHWDYLKHYLSYLIIPTLLYWGVIILMYLNPFHPNFKDGLIIITTAALSVTYWYLNETFSRNMELHQTGLKVLLVVKIFAAYLTFTSVLALGVYYGLDKVSVYALAFIGTALLVYQALFQHRLMTKKGWIGIVGLSIIMSVIVGAVNAKWGVNYFTGGLVVTAIYNTLWGIMHKYLDRTLSKQVLWEYSFMLLVLLSLIISTHKFPGKI